MKVGRHLSTGFACAFALGSLASSAEVRMDRSKFHLGAYYFKDNIADEAHVQELSDCGMDFIVGVPVTSRKTLDLFQKHGIGAVVTGVVPGWCGGGTNCYLVSQLRPRKGYVDGLDRFVKELDHPAVWMIDLTDEPGATGFKYFGELCRLFRERCPDVLPYVNLFPNYATPLDLKYPDRQNHLTVESYERYISRYTEFFPLTYISFDHYMMRDDPKALRPAYLENLRVVADACRSTGRDLWLVPGVNTTWKDRRVSANQLRYQAFSSMAYGCVSIAWACWCSGWWNHCIYDKDGKRDDVQFGLLKTVNLEIRKLSEEYMRYRNVATTPLSTKYGDLAIYYDGTFNGLRATDGSAAVVGTMAPRDPKSQARAVFVFAAADPDDALQQTRTFIFSATGKVRAYGPHGEIAVADRGNSSRSFSLKDSEAALVVCE